MQSFSFLSFVYVSGLEISIRFDIILHMKITFVWLSEATDTISSPMLHVYATAAVT